MADNTQKMSFQAGEAKGQAQVSLWITFFYFFLFYLWMFMHDISLPVHDKVWILFVSGEGQYLDGQSW
jgi:hypothetical protein